MNTNHPKKGTSTLVEPIRELEDIRSIKKMLQNKPRDLLLFTIGINNGLRIGDVLNLKVKQVQHLMPGDSVRITEQKTGKINVLMINRSVHRALQDYLAAQELEPDEYLFKSRKGDKPLTVSYANQLIKSWCKTINLRGNYGTHTLRKTFGYIQRTKYGRV